MSSPSESNLPVFNQTVTSWPHFEKTWGGLHNFLLGSDLAGDFDYQPPPIERMIEEIRAEGESIVRAGVKGDAFDLTDIKSEFLRLPLADAMRSRFVLAHFNIHPNLTEKGQLFEGIEERWVEPWRRRLLAHGFTFENVFPIAFVSGPQSASNYHLDATHQLAWQCHGVKHFHGLTDPDLWTTAEQRARCALPGSIKPAGVTPRDVYTIEQTPGTMLWNAVGTPHWVETFDGCAATLTLVHTALRYNGELCHHGEQRRQWLAAHEPPKSANRPTMAKAY